MYKRILALALAALVAVPGYAQKISADPTASTLGGSEYLAGVQSGANVKILPSQIRTYILATSPFAIGDLTSSGLILSNASGTGGAGFRLPHGAAPTSPVNGDLWTTSAGGLYVRINGATVGPLGAGSGTPAGSDTYVQYNASGAFGAEAAFTYNATTDTLTAKNYTASSGGLMLSAASATGGAGLRLPHGAAPTSPTDGDLWTTSAGGLYVRVNGVTVGPLAASGGGSLTNFTEAVGTSAPNVTTPVSSFTAANAATNVDFAILPKGNGAIVAHIPDNGTTNGNKRGTNAVDLQRDLNAAADAVAGGAASFIGSGQGNKIETGGSNGVITGGLTNWVKSVSQGAVAGGRSNTVGSNFGFVGGGQNNVAGNGSGNHPVVAGGTGNSANGAAAAVGGGDSNVASGAQAAIPGGSGGLADGQFSVALGSSASTRTMIGALAHSSAVPLNTTQGARQSRHATLQANTSGTTAVELTSNGSAASATNQFILPSNTGLCISGQVIVRNPTGGDVGKFNVDACWKNVSGTVSLSGTPVVSAYLGDASLNTCVVAAVADNTNKTAQITGAGIAATALKWTFEGWSVEVGG